MSRPKRTKIVITDVQAKPTHINKKGIKVEGMVMIGVHIKYGKYDWQKAYGFLEKDLQNFTIDAFKEKIYKESRTWIKEMDLATEVMDKLKAFQDETIYLD